MTSTTTPILLAGVDRHRERFRVRKMFPAPFGRTILFYDSADEANAAALELERRRKAGLPPTDATGDPTLAEAAAALLVRKTSTVSAKTKRRLSEDGLAFWRRSLRPWIEGEFAATPVSLLRRDRLEDALLTRAAVAPTSARNERQALVAALELAGERGARFDVAILRIPPVVVEQRKRRALTVDELEHFAKHVPDYARRLVLLQGTVGNRVDELFAALPAHLDLDIEAPTLFVPSANCKERTDKRIPLTPEEVALLREQLGGLRVVDGSSPTAACPARPVGSVQLFTKREGGRWQHSHFERHVWSKAVRNAAAAWRDERGLDKREATPFEWYVDPKAEPADGRRRDDDDGRRWITTHDLRATAVTLMRDAGVSREDAAARVGHADGGDLIEAIYDQGDRAARAGRALRTAAPHGLRAAAGGSA